MRLLIILLLFCSSGCVIRAHKAVKYENGAKIIFNADNFSGMDYYMITKKRGLKKKMNLVIDCNFYMGNLGKGLSMRRTTYGKSKRDYSVSYYIKDSAVFSWLSFSERFGDAKFVKLSDEEYNLIKDAFMTYPTFTQKYHLNVDSLRNYLGWYVPNAQIKGN